ncbi:hypothetical protein GCM10018954_093510 [Kutzneria kofuensis]
MRTAWLWHVVALVGEVVAMVGVAAPAGAIVGGETSKAEHSWIVDLGHEDNGHGCGGGLVAPRWVVTAGHCLETVHVGSRVRVGSNDREAGGEMATVAATYQGDYGDIGLIELAEPVVGKAPLKVGAMPVSGPIGCWGGAWTSRRGLQHRGC